MVAEAAAPPIFLQGVIAGEVHCRTYIFPFAFKLRGVYVLVGNKVAYDAAYDIAELVVIAVGF